jgi:hypothetical protein
VPNALLIGPRKISDQSRPESASEAFQLPASPLMFQPQNSARTVEMTLDFLGLLAAFQSEKTGSTPVGSANEIKRIFPIGLF